MLQSKLLIINLLSKKKKILTTSDIKGTLIQCCDRSRFLPDEDCQSLHCCDQTHFLPDQLVDGQAG